MSVEWTDEAVVLAARPHGEADLVVQLLTRRHGRHAGLAKGGQSKRQRGLHEPGTRVVATWKARLADHLGYLATEAQGSALGALLDRPGPLAALASVLAVAERALPEREPHPAAYDGLLALLAALQTDHWGEATVLWELQLLAELGFGLDLSACAAGGDNDQLAYVSPRTGRAVSLSAGEPWRERLLVLPGFLLGRGEGGPREVLQGLALTGHFLEMNVFHPQDRPLPPARQRLHARFAAEAAITPPPGSSPCGPESP